MEGASPASGREPSHPEGKRKNPPSGRHSRETGLSNSYGGAEGGRTPDLLNAIQALSQLSYSPGRQGRDLTHASAKCQYKFLDNSRSDYIISRQAGVVKLVDAGDSKSPARKGISVRFRAPAPYTIEGLQPHRPQPLFVPEAAPLTRASRTRAGPSQPLRPLFPDNCPARERGRGISRKHRSIPVDFSGSLRYKPSEINGK